MTVRRFILERLEEERLLPEWAASVAGDVRAGLGVLELRNLSCLWADHSDYREEWRP